MLISEHFQITVPAKEEGCEPWVDVSTTRIHTGVQTPQDGAKFNQMPVGYDATSKRDDFGYSLGGSTDVSGGINPQSLQKGFQKREMKATDDQYTGEHVDLFYGDAGGFSERNNYLDRL